MRCVGWCGVGAELATYWPHARLLWLACAACCLMQSVCQQVLLRHLFPLQAEVPAQAELALRGVNGFMPYKSAAELIKHSMAG